MPPFSVPVAAILSLPLVYVFLRRRRTAYKLEDALGVVDLQLPEGMAQEYHLPEEDREAFKEAFLNNSDYKWIATKDGDESCDPTTLRAITGYLVECVLRFVEGYGYLLVLRDTENDGAFQGAMGLIPPYSAWWLFQAHYVISISPLGKPVPETLGCNARYQAWLKSEEVHKQVMPHNSEHWYLAVVGVTPSCKGHGKGRLLTETVTRLLPKPIYLECNDETVDFFKKFYFQVDKHFELKVDVGDNVSHEKDALRRERCYFNAMTCREEVDKSSPLASVV